MAESGPPTIVRPQLHLKEFGVTELIGKDEQVAQNQFGAHVEISIGASGKNVSGEILNVVIISSGGDKIGEAGRLYFFDADPTITAGAGDMTLAEAKLLIGQIEIAASDWKNAGGTPTVKTVFKEVAIGFHAVPSIFAAYFHAGATQINSAGGDDEVFDFNVWYRTDIDETA